MHGSLFFALPAVAAAVSCTASDQQTLAKMDVNDIGKEANGCGVEAYSVFTGTFSRDTFNKCFTKKISISDSCSECYAESGEYGATNCKAACLLGWCKQGCLDCTAPAAKKVAECVGKKVKFEAMTPCLESAAPSSCSNTDQNTLASMDVNDIGKNANECGAEAYSMLSGAFSREAFNQCFTKKLSISDSCSECYAESGEYGAKNCKAACLLGWCKQGCLDCTAAATKKVAACVGKGVEFEAVTPCLESDAPSSCSNGDRHTLASMDVNDIGKQANECGAEAYSMLSGSFSREAFNQCFTKKLSISDSCSECYAESGEYGAKNCKAACLLGWCKQGCLECTASATKKVAKCVGDKVHFKPVSPCLDVGNVEVMV